MDIMEREPVEDFRAAVPLMTFQGSGLEDSDFFPSDEEEDPLEGVLNRMKYRPQIAQPHDFWPSVILAGSLCLVAGFVLSYVSFIIGQKQLSKDSVHLDVDWTFGSQFGKLVSEQHILKYAINLTAWGDRDSVNNLNNYFLRQGFDNSYVFNFTVLSSRPDPQHGAKVNLLNVGNGKVHSSYSVNISTTLTGFIDVMGPVVYVNHGLSEDWLEIDSQNRSVMEHIVVARTGRLWPEAIAEAAVQRGAKALFLYCEDEADYNLIWFPYTVSPSVGGRLQESQGFRIPVATLHRRDAEDLLRIMVADIEGPTSWDASRPDWSRRGMLQLQAHSLPQTSVVSNVVAILGGKEEPDRYVVVGARRSAGRDGTAALMLLASIISKMKSSKGWRPRRSILLASWGGEGSVGASTWVAHFQQSLRRRAVAYIDFHQFDPGGESSLVRGNALLKQALLQASSMVPEVPVLGLNPKALELPLPEIRSSCSPFQHTTGSPCLGFGFSNVSTLTAAVKLGAMVSWLLADAALLPCDVRNLADSVADTLLQVHSQHDGMLTSHDISLLSLDKAVKEFSETAARFQHNMDKKKIHNEVQVREVNDQIRQLAGAFLLPTHMKFRDEFSWPSSTTPGGGLGFGELQDLLLLCTSHAPEHSQALQIHAETLALSLHSASALLLPPARLQ
ncbi:UNVERIFIED_CONTAM: hypothetical protein B566_EDAN017952 [Ephemera danica]|nr:hypothetical protein B566_EDAN017952 [Ephemera danica]